MACLENRVKTTLAYFCDFNLTKLTESVDLDSGVSPSKSRSIKELLKRIRTFSQMAWFAKPDWLSPVNCARLGWQNIDVDLLECITCKTILSAKLPSSHNLQVYDECCKRLEFLLQNGHHSCCPWKSEPTASDLCRLTLQNRSDELKDFVSRVQGLIKLKTHLPTIEDAAFTCLKLTRDDVVLLCHLVADISPCIADVDYSVLMSACVLALCGWHISTSASCSELVECKFCDRKIGLWNYYSQNPEVDQETLTTTLSCYDDSDLAENNLGNYMETCFSQIESPFACDLITLAQDINHQLMNRNQELSGGEGTTGGLSGMQTEQSTDLTDEENPVARLSQEEKQEEEEVVSAALAETVQLEFPEKSQVTDVSPEVLVLGNLFSGSGREETLDDEDVGSTQSLTGNVLGTTDVPVAADALRSTEAPVAAEEGMSAKMKCEDADDSVNQENVVPNDTEFGTECQNSGSIKCQYDSSFEINQEYYAKCNVECEEESGSMNLICSIQALSGKLDLSRDHDRTSTVISSSDSFSASTVILTEQNLSDAGIGDGSVRDDMNEEGGSVSDETLMDGQKEGGLRVTRNALGVGEALPSVSNNVTVASDGQVTGIVYTTSVSDKHCGSQKVQLITEDQFQCGPAEASAAGLDSATNSIFEEGSNIIPEKLMESGDDVISCNRDLYDGNLFKSVINGNNKPGINDLSTNELTNQLTDQQTGQSDQPTTQAIDELTDQVINQVTPYPADHQPGQSTTQQTDESTNQLTNQLMEQLTDQPTAAEPTAAEPTAAEPTAAEPTAADVAELPAHNEDDVELRSRGSMKRMSTAAPEESVVSTKRRCLARPARVHFSPTAEHRPWCIWVRDAVIKRCQRMAGGKEEEVEEDGESHSAAQPPWIRLFRLLLQSQSPHNRVGPRTLQAVRSVLKNF